MIYIKPPEFTPPPEPEQEPEGAQPGTVKENGVIGGILGDVVEMNPLYVAPPGWSPPTEPAKKGEEGASFVGYVAGATGMVTQPANGMLGSLLGSTPTHGTGGAHGQGSVESSTGGGSAEGSSGAGMLGGPPGAEMGNLIGNLSVPVTELPKKPLIRTETVENRSSAADFKENEIRKLLDDALKNKRKP